MFRILVRTRGEEYEQVKLFDDFYSYLSERVGNTAKNLVRYDSINSNIEECAERFLKEGFVEVTE